MRRHVVVSSVIANKPFNGGNARMVLNWLEGFRKLDVEVFFVEQIESTTCVNADGGAARASDSDNRRYFEQVLTTAGFAGRSALIVDAGDDLHGATIHGATAAELIDLARDADLLVNISGHLDVPDLKRRFQRKAYIDLDPGYTQLWHVGGSDGARLADHDSYFTVGQRIGTPSCMVPTVGIPWQPVRQPIVIDDCAVTPAAFTDRFTTIASWRGAFGPVQYAGETFGAKAHEFRKLVDLPRRAGRPFEAALDIHPADVKDRELLREGGWQIVEPRSVAATPQDYCSYIERSAAECSASQAMYVKTRCGWFSDRTARYLASGKPALVQDTGFSAPGRPGEGLVVFESIDDATRGAERIARDYRRHSEAARWIAERYFESGAQLSRLMDEAGLS